MLFVKITQKKQTWTDLIDEYGLVTAFYHLYILYLSFRLQQLQKFKEFTTSQYCVYLKNFTNNSIKGLPP